MSSRRGATRITHGGLRTHSQQGVPNPGVYRASTILFPDVPTLEKSTQERWKSHQVYYGRYGTQTSFAFEEAMAEAEQADCAIATPSGMAAIAASLITFTQAGDHILLANTVYEPVRTLADDLLTRFNVTASFYDPLASPLKIEEKITNKTRILYAESPGSLTFEVQDIPALAELGKKHNCKVIVDNTWATPLGCRPLDLGADISIHAATKYIGGHSDVMSGVIVTKESLRIPLRKTLLSLGYSVSPDDAYLALRGLRTLQARIDRQRKNAELLIEFLRTRDEVLEIWYPGASDFPNSAVFHRDFRFATGLFGGLFRPCSQEAFHAFFARLQLFGMGYSWGGFESLILPTHPAGCRTDPPFEKTGHPFRVSAGLEDPQDLIEDLKEGFSALEACLGEAYP